MTGGRLKRVRDYLGGETFYAMTYGDGVSDVDIRELIRFHHQQGALATRDRGTASLVRFGAINPIRSSTSSALREKDAHDGQVINGGFFVMEPRLWTSSMGTPRAGRTSRWHVWPEQDQLAVYRHRGYWQNMDTLRDKTVLQELWDTGNPRWCVWNKGTAASSEHSRRSSRPLLPLPLFEEKSNARLVYGSRWLYRRCPWS